MIQEDNGEISVTENGEDNNRNLIVPKQEIDDDDVTEFIDCSESVNSFNDMSNYDIKRRKVSNRGDEKSFSNNCAQPQASLSLNSVDEDDLFCLSIAATLKRLSSREKSSAKLQILQILHELQFSTNPTLCNPVSKNNDASQDATGSPFCKNNNGASQDATGSTFCKNNEANFNETDQNAALCRNRITHSSPSDSVQT